MLHFLAESECYAMSADISGKINVFVKSETISSGLVQFEMSIIWILISVNNVSLRCSLNTGQVATKTWINLGLVKDRIN